MTQPTNQDTTGFQAAVNKAMDLLHQQSDRDIAKGKKSVFDTKEPFFTEDKTEKKKN